MSRTYAHSPILMPTESLVALRESFSNVYSDKKVPSKATVRPLVTTFRDTETFREPTGPVLNS
jgi:hypothetical protein